MLSRDQQILIKRAQAEAGIGDAEYRETIGQLSGYEDCTSSKDPRLGDRNVDLILAYFEAVYWRRVDAGELQPSCKPTAVFRQRGFWARKNPAGNTSRDRYTASTQESQIAALESRLAALGCGRAYCQAIARRVMTDTSPRSLAKYQAALERTLAAKSRPSNQPF